MGPGDLASLGPFLPCHPARQWPDGVDGVPEGLLGAAAEVVRAVVDVPVNMQLKLQQSLPIDILNFSSVHRQSATETGMAKCEHAATSSSSPGANFAEDREDSSVQFFGQVVDAPVVVQRQVPGMVRTIC